MPDSLLIYDPIFACPSYESWLSEEEDFHLRNQHSAFGKREGRGQRVVQEEGEGDFLALTAAGRVVSGAGLASFHRDTWVPCRRASPWLKGRVDTRVCVFPPQGLGIQRGRGGRRRQARLARPRVSVGCPPRCPPSLARVLVSGKAGGIFFTSGEEQPPAGRGRCRRRGAGLLSPPWKVFNRFSQIARRLRDRVSAAGRSGGGARRTNRGAGSGGGGGSSEQSFPCCASSRLQAGFLPPHVNRPGTGRVAAGDAAAGRWKEGGGSASKSDRRGGRAAATPAPGSREALR